MEPSHHNEHYVFELSREMVRLEDRINKLLGLSWWKKYIAAAFWGNVSMPVNLSITILTALTTAQATTENLLPHNLYVGASLLTLILTTLNTFFRPHSQMQENIKIMSKWQDLGIQFEKIYYTDKVTHDDMKRRISAYKQLQLEMNQYTNQQSPEAQNFFTDLIYVMFRAICLRHREYWLDCLEEDRDMNLNHSPRAIEV